MRSPAAAASVLQDVQAWQLQQLQQLHEMQQLHLQMQGLLLGQQEAAAAAAEEGPDQVEGAAWQE